MDPLEQLLAIEEIKQLRARYFRFVDEKKWEDLAEVFTDDAEADYSGEMVRLGQDPELGRIKGGGKAIAGFIRQAVEPMVSVHHGHMPEITITSPTTAEGVWAMEDLLQIPEGPVRSLHGFGHYRERYVKTERGWRIQKLVLTRLRVDVA